MAKEIFNYNRKLEYCNTLVDERDINITMAIFGHIAKHEEAINLDIADCNKQQCFDILDKVVFKSSHRRAGLLLALGKYIDYELAKNNSVPQINYVNVYKNRRSSNAEQAYNTQYYKDPASLYKTLTDFFGMPLVDSQFVSYFAFMCLIYCGFNTDEVLLLQRKDIDYNYYTISGKKIYPELWQPILNSLETTRKFGRGKNEYTIHNDFIIKNDVKDFVQYMKIKICKIKKEKFTNVNLTIQNVQRSGYWYSLYLNEMHGQMTDLSGYSWTDYLNYKKVFWS